MRKFIVTGLVVAAMLVGTVTAIFAQTAEPTAEATNKPTAWLGVVVVDQDGKATIQDVRSGSPADTADLQIGDVVQKFNNTAVATAADLVKAVQSAAPGDKVTLAVLRNGKAMNIAVTLGTAPNFGRGRGGFPGMPGMGQPGTMGTPIMVAQLLLRARLEETDGGFKVAQVSDQFNPLELKVGDVVTTINGHKVTELDFRALMEEFAQARQNAQGDNAAKPTLTVEVTRDGKTVTLTGDLFGGRGFGFGFGRGFGRGNRGNRGGGFGGGDNNQPGKSGTPAPTEEAPTATQPA